MDAKYSIIIFWSEEDDCFIGKIPEFPNMSASGDTFEEVAADAQSVLCLALESLKRDGIPPPPPKELSPNIEYSGQVRLRMPKSMHAELAASAEKEGVSLNTHLISLLGKGNTANILNAEIKHLFNRLHHQQNKNFAILHKKIGEGVTVGEVIRSSFSESVSSDWSERKKSDFSQVMVTQ